MWPMKPLMWASLSQVCALISRALSSGSSRKAALTRLSVRLVGSDGDGAEPPAHGLAGAVLDFVGDVHGYRGQCRGQHTEIVGITYYRSKVGNGIQGEDEVAQRAVDGGPGPAGCIRALGCVVQP